MNTTGVGAFAQLYSTWMNLTEHGKFDSKADKASIEKGKQAGKKARDMERAKQGNKGTGKGDDKPGEDPLRKEICKKIKELRASEPTTGESCEPCGK